MATDSESTYMKVYRTLVGIASLASPFILFFVVSIYNKLDSQGNRLTKVETTQEDFRRSLDNQLSSLVGNAQQDLVRWEKTLDKFQDVNQEIDYMKAIQK